MTLTPRRLLGLIALLPALLLMAACGTQPAGQTPPESTPGPTETTMSVPQEEPTPTTAQATPVLQPYANFTREQYEEAIARWRTAGVQRYRMTLTYIAFSTLGGTWNLTVNSSAGRPVVEEYSIVDGGGRNAGTTPTPEDLHMFTVEGLFERVGEIVANAPPEGLTSVPQAGGGDINFYYLVTFDPTLGYPTTIEQHPNTGPEPQIADADIVYRVDSLEVLEQQAPPPGMPLTGDPKP